MILTVGGQNTHGVRHVWCCSWGI